MSDPDNNFDDELVSANPNQRNWRGILIALLVIVVVLALIVTSVVVLTPPDEGPRVRGRRFRLADILGHEFAALRFNGSWVSGDELVFRDQWGGISLFNAANLTSRSIMSNQTFKRLNPVRFSMSPDHRYILLAHNVQKLFRYSYLAQYTIYDVATMDVFPLSPTSPAEESQQQRFLLHAAWAPRGHALVIVYDYDVYYRPHPRSGQSYRVTNTAVPGVLSNGVPDWLYEEEVLGSNEALWMSNDGHLLLFATFNDTLVEEQRFPWFGTQDDGKLYPEIRSLRYPKPGTPNPVVTLSVADLADPKNIRTRDLKPPSALNHTKELYFTAVTWVSVTEVSVVWMNRPQNLSIVTVCKNPLWICQETHRVSGEGRGWVDTQDAPLFAPDGLSYVAVAPVMDGPAGHFRHVVLVNIPRKRLLPLTHGRFDVSRLLAWDHAQKLVYYLGVPEGRPGQLHLYRITSEVPAVGEPMGLPTCLTCQPETPSDHPFAAFYASMASGRQVHDAPPEQDDDGADAWDDDDAESTTQTPTPVKKKKKSAGRPDVMELLLRPCLFHNAVFSPSVAFFALECLGPGVPTVRLYATRGPRLLLHMQNNTRLLERAAKMALPQVKTFAVQISGGYFAQVRLHLPPGLREEEITSYPLVVQVYGGPGTQLVTERWKLDWSTFLASNRDFIVAQIDGRGSGGQGYQLLHEVYLRLGSVEVDDQIEVTEYLRDSLHFVDKRRVAVWGWSYGGFVAAMALARDRERDVFHCGISVAPVTTWKLYDSAYTERYMGLPNETGNYKGYEEADVSRRAELLRDKMFYLVHGTADDNVHFQQSMALAKALANKGVLFRQQVYPDESHTLGGVKRHLYRSMANFLDDCFRKQVPPDLKAGLRNGGTSGD
ncbi:dipeptidyl aminopeptidase-like protein 6 isoform X2 [Schistocerca gregaria]|uniref:dipeptidyl aminopeptidase-like protein 6 isoform X2 n=1 Tax=Schistocerca gregaria TaxID=7010 RepID=UPI00211F34CB|nr:dipeptidyl aminopeptidase-like protein 6 isoform X2 [Schistocerca gregaria]